MRKRRDEGRSCLVGNSFGDCSEPLTIGSAIRAHTFEQHQDLMNHIFLNVLELALRRPAIGFLGRGASASS